MAGRMQWRHIRFDLQVALRETWGYPHILFRTGATKT